MDPIATIGGTATAASTVTTTTTETIEYSDPAANSSLDKDAFLTLLVAQLKYQDPTAPTDVSQMMAQTSQLSMVERLDQIAEGIDLLAGGGPLASAAGMLGREITFDIGTSSPVTATVDAVRLVDGTTVLSAGGYDVPLEALLEVRTQPATVAPVVADPTDTGTTSTDSTSTDSTSTDSTSTDTTTDSTNTDTTSDSTTPVDAA